jgi:hypothetical protein
MPYLPCRTPILRLSADAAKRIAPGKPCASPFLLTKQMQKRLPQNGTLSPRDKRNATLCLHIDFQSCRKQTVFSAIIQAGTRHREFSSFFHLVRANRRV